ncbi:hypothetical protein HK099_002481 [Clydaea vesicula]|uniref:Uncharacterized protein n=1 Tax=Clydaea vesicula TaxID=447962 RepID=A0AAD5XWR9_9FUNG|nr:hypothetical protein HK099_002481 [Clydaea vesicula]
MNGFSFNNISLFGSKKRRSTNGIDSLLKKSFNSSSSLSSFDKKLIRQREEEEILENELNFKIASLIQDLGYNTSFTTVAPSQIQKSKSNLSVSTEASTSCDLMVQRELSHNQSIPVENLYRTEFSDENIFKQKLAFVYTGFDERIGYIIVALKENKNNLICYVMTKIV